MSDKKDQNIEAIAKLLVFTQQGVIKWDFLDPGLIQKNMADGLISSAYKCSYNEKFLRIYLKKYKATNAIDFFNSSYLQNLGVKDSVEPGWVSEVVLELTDQNGNSMWQFPNEKMLRDLLEAIKYKSSGAQDLIQSLISDNSDLG